jgi:hypothetical protein
MVRATDETDGECRWSDQAIDMMPEDDQVVVAKGLKGRKVRARVSFANPFPPPFGIRLTLCGLQYLGTSAHALINLTNTPIHQVSGIQAPTSLSESKPCHLRDTANHINCQVYQCVCTCLTKKSR